MSEPAAYFLIEQNVTRHRHLEVFLAARDRSPAALRLDPPVF